MPLNAQHPVCGPLGTTLRNMAFEPELEAEIYYLSAEEGGRFGFVASNYRGQFYYDGIDYDAVQNLLGKEICNPGESTKVQLQTVSPPYHMGKFYLGKEFEIREGARTVGKGKITKVLKKEFEYWDVDSILDKSDSVKPFDWKQTAAFKKSIKEDLIRTGIIDSVDFKEIENRHLLVTCKLKNKEDPFRTVEDKIYTVWRDCKVDGEKLTKLRTRGFSLSFAIVGSHLLTGEIKIKNK